jgi:hypothetical protein
MDVNMVGGLPDALTGLEDIAAKLHREAYPDQYSETPPPEGKTDEAPPAEAPPAVEPPVEPPPAAPPAADGLPAGVVSKAEYDALAHKFAVLQGKEYAEVPRMAAEIRALKEELTALKARPAPAAGDGTPSATPPPADGADAFVARLEQEYGPEFMTDLRATIRAETAKDLEEVKAQVGTVAAVTTRSIDDQYVAALGKAVPDWQAVVADPGFATFMNEEEGRTGRPRLFFAKEAQQARDASRVAGYYLDYKQKGAGSPPAAAPAARTPSKESLVAPSTTPQGGAPAGKDEVPFVRASELDKFARDVIAGVYRGREAQQVALQARFDAAAAAGKIIPG